MNGTGTVTPEDGLRVRTGPDTTHDILGVLEKGEQISLVSRSGDWWCIESRFGSGYVHADYILVLAAPAEPEAAATYTCVAGDTLSGIAARFGCDYREIAALNGIVEPYVIGVGQVLRLPGSGGGPVSVTGAISLLNPLEFWGETMVTSSSLQGHHTPYLGSCSCDLDIVGADTPGTVVRLNLAGPAGQALRGVVVETGMACRSQVLSDGGRSVKLSIQRRAPGGDWVDCGAWVVYSHLDPVWVAPGQVVEAGGAVGALGPASGPEYFSSCAQGSHVHVEATRARCVVNAGAMIRDASVITLDV